MAAGRRSIEDAARGVIRHMRNFGNTLSLDDQRCMAKGFRESEQMLADLAHAKETLKKLADMRQQILAAADVGERVAGPGGPLDLETVEGAMTETQKDIANLEAKIRVDCAVMASIMRESNFKPT